MTTMVQHTQMPLLPGHLADDCGSASTFLGSRSLVHVFTVLYLVPILVATLRPPGLPSPMYTSFAVRTITRAHRITLYTFVFMSCTVFEQFDSYSLLPVLHSLSLQLYAAWCDGRAIGRRC